MAITLDNHDHAEVGIDGTGTLSFTIGDFTDRILVVGVCFRGAKAISTMTYNDETLTYGGVSAPGGDVRLEVWYKINPTVGTHNIYATFTGSDYFCMFASSFYNVASKGTFPAVGGGLATSRSMALTTTYDAAVNFIALQSNNTGVAATAPQTQLDVHNYNFSSGGMGWEIGCGDNGFQRDLFFGFKNPGSVADGENDFNALASIGRYRKKLDRITGFSGLL